jgi:hypothetical protein
MTRSHPKSPSNNDNATLEVIVVNQTLLFTAGRPVWPLFDLLVQLFAWTSCVHTLVMALQTII